MRTNFSVTAVQQIPGSSMKLCSSKCGSLTRAGKFKPIIFARLELDLHRVFWEVQNRGGYNAVCRGKQWKVRLDRAPAAGLTISVAPCQCCQDAS